MEIVIIGNGILGLTTAYRLIKADNNIKIKLIGPYNHKGCASLAAAAMFNSFAEVDRNTFDNEFERKRFMFNKASTPLWPDLLKEIEADADRKLEYGFGTFVINNHSTDNLEDENFDAIVDALKLFDEPFEQVAPSTIPNYKPSFFGRAGRAIYIKNEGWTNPVLLLEALDAVLLRSGRVSFVDACCKFLQQENGNISYVLLDNGDKIVGDQYVLTPGATFGKIVEASNFNLNFPKIFYGIGCSLLLKTNEATLSHCVRTPNRGLACGVYAAPQNSSHTLIGASNFISPEPNDHARITSIYTLLKAAMEQINSDYYRSDLTKVNVGWRPTSEDTLPLIGKTSINNLIVATGTKRDGLHCSPVISIILANLVLGIEDEYDIDLFKPERNPTRIYGRDEAIQIAVRQSINAATQHDFRPAKNRMMENLEEYFFDTYSKLHDKVGAYNWGIPPEMIDMYKYGHCK